MEDILVMVLVGLTGIVAMVCLLLLALRTLDKNQMEITMFLVLMLIAVFAVTVFAIGKIADPAFDLELQRLQQDSGQVYASAFYFQEPECEEDSDCEKSPISPYTVVAGVICLLAIWFFERYLPGKDKEGWFRISGQNK